MTDRTISAGFESAILPSWFQLFNKELIRNISFSEHEAFDHPVACKIIENMKYSVCLFFLSVMVYLYCCKYLLHILLLSSFLHPFISLTLSHFYLFIN